MIRVIMGKKGSGKTKQMIEMINNAVQTEHGNVVCIEKGNKLTFDIHLCINASKARIFYYKVETGAKNALDFQLATYLGSLTAQNPDENYFIVSNDDGFHYIIQFWKQRGVDIQQISNLQFQSIEENQVLDLLPAFCRDDADEIMACINEFKSKQGINNALVKQFGNKKGSEIYRAIKGLLKN